MLKLKFYEFCTFVQLVHTRREHYNVLTGYYFRSFDDIFNSYDGISGKVLNILRFALNRRFRTGHPETGNRWGPGNVCGKSEEMRYLKENTNRF